ncbi:sensor histidine kinase [Paraburkholderia rhizosphaerae]|uniref:Histidine kinase n=1 Tax=Paraburkholderia rhizosphaerae TaxID=480658 RepID=A0A4R8LSX7_9BURK|nr:ATP-binding protein [Paraburkholderia rhizosphaerae]TDY49875.1 histidine kinase [Paraburkholderia rhizosphaerae]
MDTSTVVLIGAHTPDSIAGDADDARAASRHLAGTRPAGADAALRRAVDLAPLSAELAEIERLRARVRELATEVAHAHEAARCHLAQELHDNAGAELTAARFALANIDTWLPAGAPPQCAASLAVARRSLDAVASATREVIDELHPPALDSGIVHTLSQWTGSFAARTGLRTSFVCAADARLTRLPGDAALAVFRVAQEALNNVAKHARASGADVRLETDAEHLILVVADDGIGLKRTSRQREQRFGLSGMRARCEAFDGELSVANACRPQQPTPNARNARPGTAIHARFAWRALLSTPQPNVRRRAAR